METRAPCKINLDIDAPGSYDYESFKSVKYSIKDLKDILLSEMRKI